MLLSSNLLTNLLCPFYRIIFDTIICTRRCNLCMLHTVYLSTHIPIWSCSQVRLLSSQKQNFWLFKTENLSNCFTSLNSYYHSTVFNVYVNILLLCNLLLNSLQKYDSTLIFFSRNYLSNPWTLSLLCKCVLCNNPFVTLLQHFPSSPFCCEAIIVCDNYQIEARPRNKTKW